MKTNLHPFKFKKSHEKLVFLPPQISNNVVVQNVDLNEFYDNFREKRSSSKRTIKPIEGSIVSIKDKNGVI